MKAINEILRSTDFEEMETYLEHYEILVEFFKHKTYRPPSLYEEQKLVVQRYNYLKCLNEGLSETICNQKALLK